MVDGVDVDLHAICEDDDAVFDRKDGADVCCDYADYRDLVDEPIPGHRSWGRQRQKPGKVREPERGKLCHHD